jgi:predicted metal-dependent hydrolase
VAPALDWLPAERRLELALARGRRLLERGDCFQAYRAFLAAEEAAGPAERELVRGLVHLAAACHKRRSGDERGADRQLAHARRRLAAYGAEARGVPLAALLELVGQPGRGKPSI